MKQTLTCAQDADLDSLRIFDRDLGFCGTYSNFV